MSPGHTWKELTTNSVIQRAGVVPLSIAGIFKEVSTISISAWVFGDQLTTFNIIGVVITITGEYFFTFAFESHPLTRHRYRLVLVPQVSEIDILYR